MTDQADNEIIIARAEASGKVADGQERSAQLAYHFPGKSDPTSKPYTLPPGPRLPSSGWRTNGICAPQVRHGMLWPFRLNGTTCRRPQTGHLRARARIVLITAGAKIIGLVFLLGSMQFLHVHSPRTRTSSFGNRFSSFPGLDAL